MFMVPEGLGNGFALSAHEILVAAPCGVQIGRALRLPGANGVRECTIHVLYQVPDPRLRKWIRFGTKADLLGRFSTNTACIEDSSVPQRVFHGV